jgi:hypothetical protein
MSDLIGDVLQGSISPVVCNAAVNAGGKLLKVVEMQHRYGRLINKDGQEKELVLCPDDRRPMLAEQISKMEKELETLKRQNGLPT